CLPINTLSCHQRFTSPVKTPAEDTEHVGVVVGPDPSQSAVLTFTSSGSVNIRPTPNRGTGREGIVEHDHLKVGVLEPVKVLGIRARLDTVPALEDGLFLRGPVRATFLFDLFEADAQRVGGYALPEILQLRAPLGVFARDHHPLRGVVALAVVEVAQ